MADTDDKLNISSAGNAPAGTTAPQVSAAPVSSAADAVSKAAEKLDVGARLTVVKNKLSNAQDVVKVRYRAVSDSTDDFVHDNPWKAITMGFMAGVVIGMLAAR